jgi:hypothetical protein
VAAWVGIGVLVMANKSEVGVALGLFAVAVAFVWPIGVAVLGAPVAITRVGCGVTEGKGVRVGDCAVLVVAGHQSPPNTRQASNKPPQKSRLTMPDSPCF